MKRINIHSNNMFQEIFDNSFHFHTNTVKYIFSSTLTHISIALAVLNSSDTSFEIFDETNFI